MPQQKAQSHRLSVTMLFGTLKAGHQKEINLSPEFKNRGGGGGGGRENIIKHLHYLRAELFPSKCHKFLCTVNNCRNVSVFSLAPEDVPESFSLKNSLLFRGPCFSGPAGRREVGREGGRKMAAAFYSCRGIIFREKDHSEQ